MGPVVVTFALEEASRAAAVEGLAGTAELVMLSELADGERENALRSASVVLARNTDKELSDDELSLIADAKLLQFFSAGIDFINLARMPEGLPLACNAGAFAAPMAEHALAMAFAAAKRLRIEQRELERGTFNQFRPNKMLGGGVCAIFGFGGIGQAAARLFRAVGMRVHAVNRRGATDQPVDFIGGPEALPKLLAEADVFLITAPLTRQTEGVIGAKELAAMKETAILVNLARGEIIDEKAFYEHLKATPAFTACIDAWWVEPVRHGEFRTDYPFLELENVVASPHNSASMPGAGPAGLRNAAGNIRRVLKGEAPRGLVRAED